jgi:hypothetical protein
MDIPQIDPWKHADFIYACYIVAVIGVAALTLWVFRGEARQRQRLDELEGKSGDKDRA